MNQVGAKRENSSIEDLPYTRGATGSIRVSSKGGVWFKRLLISVVFLYTGILILAPFTALILGALQDGLLTSLRTLAQPDVISAFWTTVWIALMVVVVHAVFGTLVAWTLVRQRFPGQKLLNAIIDTPFAVSPVVVGYMLLLLFGRNGFFASGLPSLSREWFWQPCS